VDGLDVEHDVDLIPYALGQAARADGPVLVSLKKRAG
jgi:hypothetical protein